MTSASTYTPIATQTLGSNTPLVYFNSIPQTYTDLVLQFNGQGTSGIYNNMTYPYIYFNGDNTSGYYSTTSVLQRNTGSGETVLTTRNSNANNLALFLANTSTVFSPNIAHIMNYSNTTTYKTVVARGNGANGTTSVDGVIFGVGLWRNPAGITSITVGPNGTSGNFLAGSTFTLYGILAA